jgi:chromosome partitioning protein
MCKVISVSNQKGGVGKSAVVENLGVGLVRAGKKVLLIDADPQGSLTISLGYKEPNDISITLATIMMCIVNEEDFPADYGILHHEEGVDLLPANIELSGMEISLGNMVSREMILRDYIDRVRDTYDYILIDCMPSLGVMTINALAAADRVIIPVQAAYLPLKGLQQLIHTVNVVRKRLNKNLVIEGILINMVDYRTNYAKDITQMLQENYGGTIGILDTYIPFSVKVAEASACGVSIYRYAQRSKVAGCFETLTKEVMSR